MQYILLLRGINVGGRTVKSAELKAVFESNHFGNVQTVLQTGNVIVESDEKNAVKLQNKVEILLTKAFNYPAKVLAVTPKQLQSVLDAFPFENLSSDYHRYIIFTKDGFESELVKNCGNLDPDTEAIATGAGVVYWRVLKGNTLDSTFGQYMNKAAVKNFITNRNVNTLEKILDKCSN